MPVRLARELRKGAIGRAKADHVSAFASRSSQLRFLEVNSFLRNPAQTACQAEF